MWKYEWWKEHKKEILCLFLITICLLLILTISKERKEGCAIEKGAAVVAIERDNMEKPLSLPLEVEVNHKGERRTYEVELTLKGREDGGNEGASKNVSEGKKDDGDEGYDFQQIEEAVTTMVEQIEAEPGTRITLPSRLENGSEIIWKHPKDNRLLLVLFFIPGGLWYIRESGRQRDRQKKKVFDHQIRRALPSFLDQLLLLLDCGMIFHDAFYRIAANYGERQNEGEFGRLLQRIKKESEQTGHMVVTTMKSFGREVGVREYVRLVNILVDHQNKGINLKEKLQSESRLLWEGRKADAMQKGKEIETKMTFPLALQLMVLIIIAGMPALMNM